MPSAKCKIHGYMCRCNGDQHLVIEFPVNFDMNLFDEVTVSWGEVEPTTIFCYPWCDWKPNPRDDPNCPSRYGEWLAYNPSMNAE